MEVIQHDTIIKRMLTKNSDVALLLVGITPNEYATFVTQKREKNAETHKLFNAFP